MQIHVIQQGDTLFHLANTYGTTVQKIADANEINPDTPLVIGQTLVIPIVGQFYTVQPGDSLYKIARSFDISYQTLAYINNIPNVMNLPVDFRLYIPPRPKVPATANAYIEPTGDTVSDTLKNSAQKTVPYLTYIAPFSYRVNRDGTLTPPPMDDFKQIAQSEDTALMLAVSNQEGNSFSSELGHIILTVQAVQNTLFDTIINTAQKGGFTDVHFDFEFLKEDDREAYNAFLRTAKERFKQAGLNLSTALAPKTSATQSGIVYEAHDYAAHGEIADFVVLMTYEWGYSGGPPRAVSPINEVRKVVEYALTQMPAEKILLGQNLYGYDWTLPYEEGGEPAEALSPQRAVTRARKQNAAIQFDTTAQAPFYSYYDDNGNKHKVWFEDARSIQAKFDLIKELDLRGISYWKLGLAFGQNWLLLEDNFNIRKL